MEVDCGGFMSPGKVISATTVGKLSVGKCCTFTTMKLVEGDEV